MPRNDGVQFKPSSIKLPNSSSSPISNQNPKFPFFKPNFACQSLSSSSRNPKCSVTHFFSSLKLPQNVRKFPFFLQKSLLGSSTLSVSQPSESGVTQSKEAVAVSRVSREGDERLLIKEVLVKGKDGKELDKELELEVLEALKASRPNSALSSREVQEDVHRIIDCGSFASCSPVVVDAKDGTKLVYEVEPNQELQGLVCEGANALPSKFIKDSFQNGYGKVVNVRRLGEVIDTINGWYVERGMFGMVSGVEILSGGILKLQVAEAEVNDVSIRFVDKECEPIAGKTKTETILRELSTKKGQIYSIKQGKRDVDTIMSMGIMDDVGILPQPAGETGKVDLVMNVVERVSGGFSAGGGISGGITNGPLSGLIGSLSYSHRNLFGKNHKVNISLERGQIDSIFRIGYKVPWIDGDGNRTRSSVMVQNSRSPGTVVHDQPDGHSLTINHVTAGVEVSRPLRPKWNGTAGVTFQRAGARDQNGNPLNMDFYSSPLTASGNSHDNTLLSKCEFNYTGDSALSAFFSMEQGVPILPGWLCFNRINSRARKIFRVGPANLLLSLSGGHVVGNFPPHEAFPIGGIDSVRGYEEGAVGSGRSYAVGCGEVSFPLYGPVDGALFADYGTDLGTGSSVPGNPAGARQKPGKGYGYGCGIRFDSPLGPLRLEYAFNDQRIGKFHFGVGYRS